MSLVQSRRVIRTSSIVSLKKLGYVFNDNKDTTDRLFTADSAVTCAFWREMQSQAEHMHVIANAAATVSNTFFCFKRAQGCVGERRASEGDARLGKTEAY